MNLGKTREEALPAGEPAGRAIHARLRFAIIRMELKPGQRLSENELAQRFGTSRAPVREAFIRLADEGLIDVSPQRGSYVTKISLSAMRRARFVREAIEIAIVRRAAANGLPESARTAAEDAIARQRAAGDDPSLFTAADDAFHSALSDSIDMDGLWAVLEREKSQFDRLRFLSVGHATPVATLLDQHRRILDAILARDPQAAETAMRDHMAEILSSSRKLIERHPDHIEE